MERGTVVRVEGPSEHPWRIWTAEETIFRVAGEPGVRYRATGRVNDDGSIELVQIRKNRPRHLRSLPCDRLVHANDKVKVR